VQVEYSGRQASGPSCWWQDISYTWTDAAGAVVVTAQSYSSGSNGSVTFACTNSPGAFVCNTGDSLSKPCPRLLPSCGGASGPCPYPSDGGSH
jgi:hypothetical protein